MTSKVFISYSWSSATIEKFVLDLATRLRSSGVDIVLDKWDLKEGQDMYSFMESMVNSDDIAKVLVLLDKGYKEKANTKSSGVGTESQIISPEIYKNVNQEKFIPIVIEVDDNGNPYIPTFLSARIYIDLSERSNFEEGFEKLVRNIFGRPEYSKPELGSPPSYILEESTSVSTRTDFILRRIVNVRDLDDSKVDGIINDFLTNFIEELELYELSYISRNVFERGEEIVENLNSLIPLRENLFTLIDTLFKRAIKFDSEVFHLFLEKLYSFERFDNQSSYAWKNDNYKYLIHEIFLSIIGIALRHKKIDFIDTILNSSYYIRDRREGKIKVSESSHFLFHVDSINQYYNKLYNKNFINPQAEFLIRRVSPIVTKRYLIEADILCYFINSYMNLYWYPMTYLYKEYRYGIEFIERMDSKKYNDKFKVLLNNIEVPEFAEVLSSKREAHKNRSRFRFGHGGRELPFFYEMIVSKKIGTQR